MKNTKRIFALMLALLLLLAGCGAKESTGETITVTVEFDTSAVEYDGELVGKSFEVKAADGATVFDTLKQACEENDLELNYDDSTTLFMTGIGDLNMGDISEVDGWVYTVNGEDIWDAADVYKLKDGDTVTWKFMTW